MREYKVLSQKDKWLTSKFDPETLEKALNGYAEQGWRVRTGDSATFPGVFGTERNELITILERETEETFLLQQEYKVLTQKDKWLSNKFDPEKIEEALNAYGKQGWRVVYCTTATFPGFLSGREELVVILSRDRA